LVIGVAVACATAVTVCVVALLLGLIPSIRIRSLTPPLVLAVLLPITAAFEEIGWRGFALLTGQRLRPYHLAFHQQREKYRPNQHLSRRAEFLHHLL
jgi:membrane protease YdiL (CAAX protease family)